MDAGKNFAGDETWDYLNNQVTIDLSESVRSEIDFLKSFLGPIKLGAECIEIGSFPGSMLPTLGNLGYILNGIDISPRNENELPEKLNAMGYKIGKFWSKDFFKFKPKEQFDLVCSFGFVEHFENYLDVIKMHAEMTKQGGYLVITAPNFRGFFQYIIHYLFDKKNLKIHNIKSMRPKQWAQFLVDNGFEIKFAGYFGGFYIWLGNKGGNKFNKFLLYVVYVTVSKLNKLLKKESSLYSYNCGVVARKKNENSPLS